MLLLAFIIKCTKWFTEIIPLSHSYYVLLKWIFLFIFYLKKKNYLINWTIPLNRFQYMTDVDR